MFDRLREKIKGWRTTIGASAIGVIGALQLFGTVDITPLLKIFLKDDQIVGAVMVVLALGGVWMRYVTTTPIGTSPPAPMQPDAPTAPSYNYGVDAGE